MLPEDLLVPMQYCRSCPCLVTAAMVGAAVADVVVVAVVVAVVVHLHIEMLENDVFLL